MSRRSKDQLEQDRADLVAVLEEAKGPLRTDAVVARALGYPTWDEMIQVYEPGMWAQVQQATRDLSALRRAGKVVSRQRASYYSLEWRLATAEDLDADEDQREVARMQAHWQEDDEPAPPTAVQQVEAMVAAGSMRLCRQSGPISEAEAQVLVDFAVQLRERGAQ